MATLCWIGARPLKGGPSWDGITTICHLTFVYLKLVSSRVVGLLIHLHQRQVNHTAAVGVPTVGCLFALIHHCLHERWSVRRWTSFYAAINANEVGVARQILTSAFYLCSSNAHHVCLLPRCHKVLGSSSSMPCRKPKSSQTLLGHLSKYHR